jgi:hypothetical protein
MGREYGQPQTMVDGVRAPRYERRATVRRGNNCVRSFQNHSRACFM